MPCLCPPGQRGAEQVVADGQVLERPALKSCPGSSGLEIA